MFCLAFGSSKLNHDKVIVYYLKEIKSIMKGKYRYYGKNTIREKVYTSFGLGLYSADTPDRNSTLHRLHLGLFGKRSLHATRIDPNKLPSCNNCFRIMVNTALAMGAMDYNGPISTSRNMCHRCCNWDHFTSSSARFSDSTENTNYPTSCSKDNPHIFPVHRTVNESHLVCVRQNFPWLIQGMRAAFYEHTQGEWKTKK